MQHYVNLRALWINSCVSIVSMYLLSADSADSVRETSAENMSLGYKQESLSIQNLIQTK